MIPILETERLRLKQFCLEDAPFIIELLNSPGWLQNIGDRNVKTQNQATFYLTNGPLKSYAQQGHGLSLVERKEDQKPIGMCGILHRDTLDTPDIGFALLPAYTGQGYGYEIAQATLAYAQNELQLPVIAAITLPSNQSSIHVIEKLGMLYQHDFRFPGSEETLLLYKTL